MKNGLKIGVITEKSVNDPTDLITILVEDHFFPGAEVPDPDWDYYLRYRNGALELCDNHPGKVTINPISINFSSGASLYRFKFDRKIKQPFARAVGIKPGVRPNICDLTAGFGGDGFVLAGLGCSVVLVERSPLIWALLEDGLRRGRKNRETEDLLRSNIRLVFSEARTFLENTDQTFDTLFLDPMYPKTVKKSLTKIKMRVLRDLVGDDDDSAELLRCSIAYPAKQRVVVKRPVSAPIIEGYRPSFEIRGKKHRYDIYLPPYL